MPQEQLQEVWLLVLLYYLLLLQLVLHGGAEGNRKNISLMYLVRGLTEKRSLNIIHGSVIIHSHFLLQLKRTQRFIWGSLKGFHCENYRLRQIVLATKTFWVEVDLVRCTKDA